MEIGSAYALQVCLLQIPALVAVSAFLNRGKQELQESTFSLIFPRWDLITVILCVFLLAYMYGEGKSNYFKVTALPVLSITLALAILSRSSSFVWSSFCSYSTHLAVFLIRIALICL